MEEKQRRMDSARRSSLQCQSETGALIQCACRSNMDPSILPNLVSKCEQEGSLRRDRGEQVLDKIRSRTLNLHNMLSVEDGAHGSLEDFTQNIVGKVIILQADACG